MDTLVVEGEQQLEEVVLVALAGGLVGRVRLGQDPVDLGAHDEGDLGAGVLGLGLGRGGGGGLVLEEDGHVVFVVVVLLLVVGVHCVGVGVVVVIVVIVVVVEVLVHLDVHGIVGAAWEGLVDGDVVEGAVDFVVLCFFLGDEYGWNGKGGEGLTDSFAQGEDFSLPEAGADGLVLAVAGGGMLDCMVLLDKGLFDSVLTKGYGGGRRIPGSKVSMCRM